MTWNPKDLKVGDLVTAYHAGYHVITKIERRFVTKDDLRYTSKSWKLGEEYSPLVYYKTVANANFKKTKSKAEKACDYAFVAKITLDTIEATQKEYLSKIDQMYDIFNEFGNGSR